MGCKGCPQMAGKRLDPSAINRDRLRTLIAWMVSAEPLLSLMKAVAAGGGPFRPPGRL